MLQLKKIVYQNEDVLNVNIACFIYSSIGREEIANVQWDCMSLPTPWNPKPGNMLCCSNMRDLRRI